MNYINFWDDLSFASAKHAKRLADAILYSGLKFSWSAAVRVDLFSRAKLTEEEALEVARKMYGAGCRSVGFSLESGNRESLEMMNKKIAPEAFLTTTRVLGFRRSISSARKSDRSPARSLQTVS